MYGKLPTCGKAQHAPRCSRIHAREAAVVRSWPRSVRHPSRVAYKALAFCTFSFCNLCAIVFSIHPSSCDTPVSTLKHRSTISTSSCISCDFSSVAHALTVLLLYTRIQNTRRRVMLGSMVCAHADAACALFPRRALTSRRRREPIRMHPQEHYPWLVPSPPACSIRCLPTHASMQAVTLPGR